MTWKTDLGAQRGAGDRLTAKFLPMQSRGEKVNGENRSLCGLKAAKGSPRQSSLSFHCRSGLNRRASAPHSSGLRWRIQLTTWTNVPFFTATCSPSLPVMVSLNCN